MGQWEPITFSQLGTPCSRSEETRNSTTHVHSAWFGISLICSLKYFEDWIQLKPLKTISWMYLLSSFETNASSIFSQRTTYFLHSNHYHRALLSPRNVLYVLKLFVPILKSELVEMRDSISLISMSPALYRATICFD